MRLLKAFGILVLLMSLLSCSRAHLALQFVDDFVAYELSSDFNFKGEADDQVEELTTQVFNQLKRQMLPVFISEIETAIAHTSKIKALEVSEVQDLMQKSLDRTLTQLKDSKSIFLRKAPEFSNLVQKENWAHFISEFEKENAEILKDKPESRVHKNFERFLGNLTKDQKKEIEDFLQNNQFDPQLRVSNRKKTLENFQKELSGDFSSEKFLKVLTTWIENPERFGDPEAQAYYEKRRVQLIRLTASIFKMMDDKQSKHLIQELLQLKKDLQESLNKAGATAN